jgi:hypothetical protein
MTKEHKPAGGLRSRNVTQRPVRVGDRAREMRPKGVSQIGASQGNHATERREKLTKSIEPVRGARIPGVPLGNASAKELSGPACGPGRGRTVMASGAQGQHGSVNPGRPTPARDILSDFGPDYKR